MLLLFKRGKSVFDYIILYKRLFKLDVITLLAVLVSHLVISPLGRSLFLGCFFVQNIL